MYLQDAQKCICFLCIVCLCKGYACLCVCVSPAHPFDCLHFDKQSHFNFRIYFWVWISQLSSVSNAIACNAFLLKAYVCMCKCMCCLPAAFFIMQKIAYHFFVFHFGYFFEMHSTKLHVSLRASFVRTAGIKKRNPTKKCIRNWGGFSGVFYLPRCRRFFSATLDCICLRGFNFNCFS